MKSSQWLASLENVLRKQGSPVFEQTSNEGKTEILSAANLWTCALERKRSLVRSGFRAGDILCESSHSHEFLVSLLACAMAGGKFWPMSPADYENLTPIERSPFEICLRNSSGKIVQTPEFGLETLEWLAPETVLILKTSGTIDRARLVGMSGEALIHQVASLNSAQAIEPESGRLSVLPFHHCFGLIVDLLAGLFAKQTVFIRSHQTLSDSLLFRLLAQEHIEHISLVPRMLEMILFSAASDPDRRRMLARLNVHAGGAPLTQQLRRKCQGIFAEIREGYGLTECSGGVMLDGRPNQCEVKLKPLEDAGQIGMSELWIRSPAIGFFSDRETRVDSDGFLRSGDLAKQHSDGRIEVLGRIGDAFKDQSGSWTSIEVIAERIGQALGCEPIGIHRKGTMLHLVFWQKDRVDAQVLEESILKRYGLQTQLHFLDNSENVVQILSSSSRKSTQLAVADWLERRLCG